MTATICPHCGAENLTSPLITLCEPCGEPLSDAAKQDGPVLPRPDAAVRPPEPPVFPVLRPPEAPPPLMPTAPSGSPPPRQGAQPTPPAIAPTGFAIPLRLHTGLFVALPPICGFLGFALFGLLMFTEQLDVLPLGSFGHTIAFFGLTLGGVQLPRLLLMHVVPARCPQCGGPTKVRGTRPMTYQCRVCGHLHRTSTSEGNYSAGVGS
jgi:ribosomal protein L37AE/L43A